MDFLKSETSLGKIQSFPNCVGGLLDSLNKNMGQEKLLTDQGIIDRGPIEPIRGPKW